MVVKGEVNQDNTWGRLRVDYYKIIVWSISVYAGRFVGKPGIHGGKLRKILGED